MSNTVASFVEETITDDDGQPIYLLIALGSNGHELNRVAFADRKKRDFVRRQILERYAGLADN